MLRSKLLVVSIIAVILMCCQVQAIQKTIKWNICGNGRWEHAVNWNPAVVPENNGDTYVVEIDPCDLECGYGVWISLIQNHTIDKLDCYGEVGLESEGDWAQLTLEHPDGLTNHGFLDIEEMDIIGDVTNRTGAWLELGDIDIEGNLYNAAGASMAVEWEVYLEDWTSPGVGSLDNYGFVEIIPTGQLQVEEYVYNPGTIMLYDGICESDTSYIYNDIGGIIAGFGLIFGGQQVWNEGDIVAYGGSLVVVSGGPVTNAENGLLRNEPLSSMQIKPWLFSEIVPDANNHATIEVNAGGGVAFDCGLLNESGGTIDLLGGTLSATTVTQTANAEFKGFGSIAGDVVIQDDAKMEINGPTNIIGDVAIDSRAVVMISAGQTLITGRTTNNGTILLTGGTVLFQGGYSGSGKIIDATLTAGLIIDNGDDGTSSTGTWKVSGVAGCYGQNSLYASANGATYSFETWRLGSREISLWWTAHPSRSNAVPVAIYSGTTLLDTKTVNQRNNGGKWNILGSYNFTNEAEVRIVSPGGGATVADAVRFGPSNEIIIDNGDEGTSSTGSWRASSLAGYYGDNSLYSSKSGDSYTFEAPVFGYYNISLWWTAHANRSSNVTVEIFDGGTLLGTFSVNQQENGGQWNLLAGRPFSYGAKVKIICPGDGNNAVADAVKIAPAF